MHFVGSGHANLQPENFQSCSPPLLHLPLRHPCACACTCACVPARAAIRYASFTSNVAASHPRSGRSGLLSCTRLKGSDVPNRSIVRAQQISICHSCYCATAHRQSSFCFSFHCFGSLTASKSRRSHTRHSLPFAQTLPACRMILRLFRVEARPLLSPCCVLEDNFRYESTAVTALVLTEKHKAL